MGEDQEYAAGSKKKNNTLPHYGNESMNLNALILTNIQSSIYFKATLFQLKTYHEVIDEIYYNVKHLEPWERGSRKTAGNSGMCGSVRGVGAGGIVSSAYCLLYKLYTLKLTRKQLNGLLKHADSPYIRGLGFMYIRYALPPSDFFDWYEEFLQDEEEVDVKAGGGQTMTIGQMCRQFLTKLEWFSTLFPRIPVPVQKQIDQKLMDYDRKHGIVEKPVRDYGSTKSDNRNAEPRGGGGGGRDNRDNNYEKREKGFRDEGRRRSRSRSRSREKNRKRYDDEYRHSKRRSDSRERHSSSRKSKYYDRDRSRSKEKSKRYEEERYHRH